MSADQKIERLMSLIFSVSLFVANIIFMKKLLFLFGFLLSVFWFSLMLLLPDYALALHRSSGIVGQVLRGPVAPICTRQSTCYVPYDTSVIVYSADGTIRIKTFNTDKDGKFNVSLKPGTYLLVDGGYNKFIKSKVVLGISVSVVAGQLTQVTLYYDSGIR